MCAIPWYTIIVVFIISISWTGSSYQARKSSQSKSVRTLRFCCAFYFEPREKKRERENLQDWRDILLVGVGRDDNITANFGFKLQQIQPAAGSSRAAAASNAIVLYKVIQCIRKLAL